MHHIRFPNQEILLPWLRHALAEDIGSGDITSQLLIPETARAVLQFRSRQPMTLAGMPLLPMVLDLLTQDYTLTLHYKDGAVLNTPALIATVEGPARALLSAERLALNLLQRCSGVATLTRHYVDAVAGTGVQVLDTRKTMPGMRLLDKYAVTCGGGQNHRMRLDDRILIKDNHIAVCGGIDTAIEQAIAGNHQTLLIEVECDTLAQVKTALQYPIHWLLLDNMSLAELREAVALAQGKAVQLEASGGVNLQTIRAIAETGVNAVSVGALTHSAPAVDIGLDVEMLK